MAAIDLALDIIKKFEGLRLKAYQDEGGIWTVGYGAIGKGIGPTTVWTIQQAEDAIRHYVTPLMDVIEDLVTVPVTDNQKAALTSLGYNIGSSAFATSTVLRKLNAGDVAGAADAFLMWRKVNGKDSAGLLNRRQAERALFLKS